jgi:hypothetical protein
MGLCFTSTGQIELIQMDKMKKTFGQDSLPNIQNDFLNNYIKKEYSTSGLFRDEEKGFNYLVIVENDPQYSAQPSTMIIWRNNYKPFNRQTVVHPPD